MDWYAIRTSNKSESICTTSSAKSCSHVRLDSVASIKSRVICAKGTRTVLGAAMPDNRSSSPSAADESSRTFSRSRDGLSPERDRSEGRVMEHLVGKMEWQRRRWVTLRASGVSRKARCSKGTDADARASNTSTDPAVEVVSTLTVA